MQKLARLSAALVLAVCAATAVVAQSSIASSGFTVSKGSVKATVNGVTKTYKAGDVVPAQAKVVALEDAEVTASNGMVLSVSKGGKFQAAMTADGQVDVRANKGSVTVKGYGHTTVVPAGSEINAGGGTVQVIKGSATTTDAHGTVTTAQAQQGISSTGIDGSYTLLGNLAAGTFNSILVSPATPNQQTTVAPVVSPSAP